jgi:hypothetical protein
MQKHKKVGAITNSHGIVMAVVYQNHDGSLHAGEIGDGRDIQDLQSLLPKGFAFRPCKDALERQSQS